MSNLAETDRLFFDRAGLDRGRVESMVTDSLKGADDGELYLEYAQSEALSTEAVGKCYGIDPARVQIIPHPKANAIKITLPRISGSRGAGSPADRDVYGAPQHGPLLKLNLPDLR